MSAAFMLGCLHKERPKLIERIGHHEYRVAVESDHQNLRNTFIGAGFDWKIATTEKPFNHLPFESFLAISVFRWVAAQQSKPIGELVDSRLYTPTKLGHRHYSLRTAEERYYSGFLFDWKHQHTEELVEDVVLQASLSYDLLIWLCRFKEWKYEREMQELYFNKEIGVLYGDRRGGEELPFEP